MWWIKLNWWTFLSMRKITLQIWQLQFYLLIGVMFWTIFQPQVTNKQFSVASANSFSRADLQENFEF